MKAKIFQWAAMAVIVEIGLLHLMLAQSEYEEAAYMGYLFAANFFGALLAAIGIYRKWLWGWILGLAIVVGSLAGYAWSRTLGMPGMEVEEWYNPYGIVAMSLEGIFILFLLLRPWKIPENPSPLPVYTRVLFPLAGVAVLAAVSLLTFNWDAKLTQEYGSHVGTLEQVLDTPAESMEEVRAKYGVEVSLVATSMMNSILDVRVRILDPDKAHALLNNQAAVLVDQQALILAPHMHAHGGTRLIPGKNYLMFFPTQKIVTPGSKINLVFGSVRIEAIAVR